MKQTIITYPSGNTAIQLTPDDGYKYVSNDNAWSESVILGKNDLVDNWHDTNDEPPTPPEPSEEATIDDYQAQMERLGVSND